MSVYVEKIFGLFGRRSVLPPVLDASNHAETTSAETTSAGTTTGGSIDQEPVAVWEAANSLEAQIIIGRLESENIPAITQGEALGTIYGFTSGGLAKTDVLVPAPLAEKAILLLETEFYIDEDTVEDDTDEIENRTTLDTDE